MRVPPEDRDVLSFLWWPDENLRHSGCVLTCLLAIGVPAVAILPCNSDAARVVQMNFYVDDCLVSVQDEAVKPDEELRMLL